MCALAGGATIHTFAALVPVEVAAAAGDLVAGRLVLLNVRQVHAPAVKHVAIVHGDGALEQARQLAHEQRRRVRGGQGEREDGEELALHGVYV